MRPAECWMHKMAAQDFHTPHLRWESPAAGGESSSQIEHAGCNLRNGPVPRPLMQVLQSVWSNSMNDLASLRTHIIDLLTKAEAHVDARSELKDFPANLRGRKPEGTPHTPWQLLEHLRIA